MRVASAPLPMKSYSAAISRLAYRNRPAIITLSALLSFTSPAHWKLSFGSVEKQFRFRQSFQSAWPISGNPCGPRFFIVYAMLTSRWCSRSVLASGWSA